RAAQGRGEPRASWRAGGGVGDGEDGGRGDRAARGGVGGWRREVAAAVEGREYPPVPAVGAVEPVRAVRARSRMRAGSAGARPSGRPVIGLWRSEEHTSELKSRENLVCRLLLEKKKRTHREYRVCATRA